ncbi:hypothetical protein [Thiosulfativibrio zosterae]|uniref:Uncharacterized protein n=1 Tax=Thiosulfativibrio zosterae TaxID=2675053 RepID=A0A6F8PR47_9GAMM|nr:hypothetical protein [Thiosulfativibrio zosterae]BBP44556.1 hypothetical protein THMIRHAT_23020 [Thiosulfativibrio zosterae]
MNSESFEKKMYLLLEHIINESNKKEGVELECLLNKAPSELESLELNCEIIDLVANEFYKKSIERASVDPSNKDLRSVFRERNADFLILKSLRLLSKLLAKDALLVNQRGRPNKAQSFANQRWKDRLNGKSIIVTINGDREKLFSEVIEGFRNEEGSYNKAYKKYAAELSAETGKDIKAVTIRRKFEKYKKSMREKNT